MKNVNFYINRVIKEAKATNAKNVDTDDIPGVVDGGKKGKPHDVPSGLTAEKNGSGGRYAVDPPTPEDEASYNSINWDSASENTLELDDRFASKHDFMVIGDAGWAKTDLITGMAKKHGYHVITVYLDKAEATDLGGIPVPTKNEKTGREYVNYYLPIWADVLLEETQNGKKFLLFFDEMNQAQPDVLNALMPIVLKHEICGIKFDNIIVGAAGNHEHENDSVSNINKPLRDRLKPIIEWETHTDETWAEHFAWAHKKYDDKIGKEVVDKCEEMQQYWNSPRDITRVIYNWCLENKNKPTHMRPKQMVKHLEACWWDDMSDSIRESRKFIEMMNKFAEFLVDWSKNGGNVASGGSGSARKSKKDGSQVNKDDKEAMMTALENGYFFNSSTDDPENGDDEYYSCTVENCITAIFDPSITGITAEVFKQVLREMEAKNRKPKYKTNKEAEEAFKDMKNSKWHHVEVRDGHTYIDGEQADFMGTLVRTHVNPESQKKKEKAPEPVRHDND